MYHENFVGSFVMGRVICHLSAITETTKLMAMA